MAKRGKDDPPEPAPDPEPQPEGTPPPADETARAPLGELMPPGVSDAMAGLRTELDVSHLLIRRIKAQRNIIAEAEYEEADAKRSAKNAKNRLAREHEVLRDIIDGKESKTPLLDNLPDPGEPSPRPSAGPKPQVKHRGRKDSSHTPDGEENGWRGISLDVLLEHGLPRRHRTALAKANYNTFGQISDLRRNRLNLEDIPGISMAGAQDIDEAFASFWASYQGERPMTSGEARAESGEGDAPGNADPGFDRPGDEENDRDRGDDWKNT